MYIMEKINIAELLKDCPKGMELDCTIYDGVVFHDIVDRYYPIMVRRKQGGLINLNAYGCLNDKIDSKCVIFPKGKTTWEGFVPPCKFKDGDIVVTTLDNIVIIRKPVGKELSYVYGLMVDNYFYVDETAKVFVKRLATEEEKQKLFDAIKDNGYKWNAETKTLEKLVEPKFKVGDRIKEKQSNIIGEIIDVQKNKYNVRIDDKGLYLYFREQDNWELVPNKFDINTLVPFESKVLVRATDNQFWRPAIWGVKQRDWDFYCVVGGEMWEQCIPYEGNEHLLCTTDNCDEYYKTW